MNGSTKPSIIICPALALNGGIRRNRVLAAGEYVPGYTFNLEFILERGLGSMDQQSLIGLIESTLMHYGFIATHRDQQKSDYHMRFSRGRQYGITAK